MNSTLVGDFRDHLDVGAGLRQDQLVDAPHVGPRQRNQRLDRRLRALAILEFDHYAHRKTPSMPFPACHIEGRL
jgi:hypothetical protein